MSAVDNPPALPLLIFESTLLDINVLSIAIVNCSDTFVEPADYSPSSYRKAAYRQFILWAPWEKKSKTCAFLHVGNRYPAPDGLYLGFKKY